MIHTCRRTLQRCALLALAVLLAGCSSIVHKPLTALVPGPHKIAIFFDGTHNDIASDTNIKRLHSLVSLQDKRNISSVYIEGVGTGTDVIGAGTGFGMERRVRIGYEFILNHYRTGDEIYIFGFSRGAYAARILTSILYNTGIVAKSGMPASEVASVVYDEFKYPIPEEDEFKRKDKVRLALENKGLTVSRPVSVDVLGLWDTVEAMGVPEWMSRILHKAGISQHTVNIDASNTRYGDQLCNVKRAYQALSIDDDREWIFTPLPLDRTHLFRHCEGDGKHLLDAHKKIKPGYLREVWFSGAHTDVGGGYADSLMSGVSLNWMIDNLKGDNLKGDNQKGTGLLPADAKVPADPFGTSHDPEAGWWGPLYHAVKRDIATYVTQKKPRHTELTQEGPRRDEFRNTLCVHPSVLKRRLTLPLKYHENDLLSLRKAGNVRLVPDKEATRKGWTPQLREATDGDPPGGPLVELEVQVWPDCEVMR